MRPVFLAQTISETEDLYRGKFGEAVLMQRASFGIATRTANLLRQLTGHIVGSKVLLLVGSGDNGGDALFAGAHLLGRGVHVHAVLTTDHPHEAGLRTFLHAGGEVIDVSDLSKVEVDVVLDGIVGTGLHGALRDHLANLVEQINQSEAFVVAIDLPSGVLADTGEVIGSAVQADATLTIGGLKTGLLTGAGRGFAGTLDCIDIDVAYPDQEAIAHVLDYQDVAKTYPLFDDASYKYSRGVVGLHVGSVQYPGAALLAVQGALSSGVGMVRFDSPVASQVIAEFPEVVLGLKDERVSAFAIGSGGSGSKNDLMELLNTEKPVVIDAHALSYLIDSDVQQLLKHRKEQGAVTVITPHEGEAKSLGFSGSNRMSIARNIAQTFHTIVVLKGPGTVIADADGNVLIDLYGSNVLGTAGTGDVLTGLIAGTLATQQSPSIETVAAAVAVHGLAGRTLPDGATASDVAKAILQVRAQLQNRPE